ncbi:MAG TPA: NUDIX hydrolase [Ktedonobacteraceae bacterium]|jgi:8-oxo-dGTP diphosphatase|nr:NUDIX hydrolase [Ktedonobacteraceae bacterium]
MSDPDFRYCPLCATPLTKKWIDHVQRTTCPQCTFIHYPHPKLVAIAVVHQGDTLLLGKRAIEPKKDLWSFFGGYVEQGEQVEQAAIREVKEETNLDVQLEGLIGIYSEQGEPHVLVVYEASILNTDIGTLSTPNDEVSELAFFPQNELPPLAFPVDHSILRDRKKLL